MESYEIIWKSVLEGLENSNSISPITYNTFIKNLTPIDLKGNTLVLMTKSAIFAETAMGRLKPDILKVFKKLQLTVENFDIFVGTSK